VDGFIVNSLFGNQFGKPITLDASETEMQAIFSIAVAHGREIKVPAITDYLQRLAVGGGVKLLIGGGYAGFENFSVDLTTYHDRIAMEGDVTARAGAGGFGIAFDAGVAAQINDKMAANLAFNNLLGTVGWGFLEAKEKVFKVQVEIPSDQFDKADSLIDEGITVESIRDIDGLSSAYPSYLIMGFEYRLLDNLRLFSNYKQYLTTKIASSVTPILAFGVELHALPFLPVRTGISLGGQDKFIWSFGFGLNFTRYNFDLGFSQVGGMFNHSRGFAFAMGQSLSF